MGDRCYLSIMIRKDQRHLLEEVGLECLESEDEDLSNYPNAVALVNESANYALANERLALAKKGAVFFGTHSAGSEYSAATFVGAEGLMAEVPTNYGNELMGSVSFVDGDVVLRKDDKDELLLYHRLIAIVETELGAEINEPLDIKLVDQTDPSDDLPKEFNLFVGVTVTANNLRAAYLHIDAVLADVLEPTSFEILEEFFVDDEEGDPEDLRKLILTLSNEHILARNVTTRSTP